VFGEATGCRSPDPIGSSINAGQISRIRREGSKELLPLPHQMDYQAHRAVADYLNGKLGTVAVHILDRRRIHSVSLRLIQIEEGLAPLVPTIKWSGIWDRSKETISSPQPQHERIPQVGVPLDN
jgi:hypothetical protein